MNTRKRGRNKTKARFLRWLRTLGMIGPLAACAANNNNNNNGDLNKSGADLEESEEETLALRWKSDGLDPERGQISATIANGSRFTGRYVEVVPNAQEEFYKPTWEGWQPYWSEWTWDGDVATIDWPRFVHTFTGTVVANLMADDGQTRLRCRFIIDTPTTGLEGSDRGLCELSDGEIIEDIVLAPQ